MKSVLGIDAAWSSNNPSGVAAAIEADNKWRLIAAEACYEHFHDRSKGIATQGRRPTGSILNIEPLLSAFRTLCGVSPSLVTVDMPLARSKIFASRKSDRCITSCYGSRNAGAYSPRPDWPGKASEQLLESFRQQGFELATDKFFEPAVFEVYPHPALIELTGQEKRLMYKVGKRRDYWPQSDNQTRKNNLFEVWELILSHLGMQMEGTLDLLRLPNNLTTFSQMKWFEDTLDAVICCWIGICILEGKAQAFGDHESAIWVPRGEMIRG